MGLSPETQYGGKWIHRRIATMLPGNPNSGAMIRDLWEPRAGYLTLSLGCSIRQGLLPEPLGYLGQEEKEAMGEGCLGWKGLHEKRTSETQAAT